MKLKNDSFGVCRVIYKPGELHLQSATYICEDTGLERVRYTGGKTLAEYMADKTGQGLEVMPYEMAAPMIDAAQVARYCKPWLEITEKEWWANLEVLPPEKWRTDRGVEIFRMSEYTSGNITGHFARLGERYFSANRDTRTEYDDIAAEIAALVKERGAA
jgi:hypothetical protein